TVATEIAKAINDNVANQSGLNASAAVQFNQVVLSGPLTVTPSGSQGGVTYTLARQIVARNDDYFGTDSFVNLHLTPGVYYVAVTSAGNTQFDPSVPGSGAGGTTQGAYDLKLDFTPDRVRNLTDTNGTPLQGNSNGTSGGAYDFWFNVGGFLADQPAPNTRLPGSNSIFVDKNPPASDANFPLGSVQNPYTNVADALQTAADRIMAPAGSTPGLDGQTFVINDGFDPPVTFEFAANGRQVTDGNEPINFSTSDSAVQVAADIVAAISASTQPLQVAPTQVSVVQKVGQSYVQTSVNAVDISGASFVDAAGAPALLSAAKLVRILGSAGADNSIGVPAGATGASVIAGQTFQVAADEIGRAHV